MPDATLVDLLTSKNQDTLAWMQGDPTKRFAGCYTLDLAHWHEMGIYTAADLIHYELVIDVYEHTKAVYGYKPSWKAVNEMSDIELKLELSNLALAHTAQAEWEKEYDKMREAEIDYQNCLTEAERWLQIEGELQFTKGHWNVCPCMI